MAIIKYNPKVLGVPKVPTRVTPAQPKIVPMGQSDIDAGNTAGSGFTVGINFGSTGGSTGGATSSLGASNLAFKTAQATATAARNKRQAEYIRGLLGLKPGENPPAGAYDDSINNLLTKVGEEEKRQLGDIGTQYGTAKTGINTLYGTASGQVKTGYDTLKTWLANNAPNAYAGATRATPVNVDNALAQYQAAQGVSSAPVDAAVAAMNVAGQGGAANYNNLLNTLAAAERAGQQSRLAEATMAQNLAGTRLTAAQTAALNTLLGQQTAAENAVRSQFGQTRLSAEQARIQRQQTLQDALRALIGY